MNFFVNRKTELSTAMRRGFCLVAAVFMFICGIFPVNAVKTSEKKQKVFSDSAISVGWGEGYDCTFVRSPLEYFADGYAADIPFYLARKLSDAKPEITVEVLYDVTPVIFARPEKHKIMSWGDALSGTHTVMLSNKKTENIFAVLSASNAVYGTPKAYKKTISKLRNLKSKGLIVSDEADADLIIGLDFETHEGFSPIVPSDGSLSFSVCAVSQNVFTVTDDARAYFSKNGAERAKTLGGKLTSAASLNVDISKCVDGTNTLLIFLEKSGIREKMGPYGYIVFTVAVIFLLVAWCVTALRRSMQKSFTRCVFGTGVFIALWLIARTIKWATGDEYGINTFLWYSFYVYFLGLPLLLLWMASKVGDRADNGRPPKFWYAFLAVSVILVAMVFTNSSHNLVFRINNGNINDYTYGPLYYTIVAFIAVMISVSLAVLYRKSKASAYKPFIALPIALFALPIICWLLYIWGADLLVSTDVTLFSCLYVVCVYEIILRTGLVPCNMKYKKFFASSPLALEIIDSDGKQVFHSEGVRSLSEEDIKAVENSDEACVKEDDPDVLLSRIDIPGGVAVWQQDISAINRDAEELRRSIRSLQNANKALAKRERVEAQRVSEKEKLRLFDELDEEIKSALAELRDIVSRLPDEMTEENADEYKTLVGAASFVLCYIKRRSSLHFKRMGKVVVSFDDVVTRVSELCEFAGQTGLACAAYQSVGGSLPADKAEVFYDFCFGVLDYSMRHNCDSVILRFYSENECIIMSVIGEASYDDFAPNDNLRNELDGVNAKIEKKCLFDAHSITLTVKEAKTE